MAIKCKVCHCKHCPATNTWTHKVGWRGSTKIIVRRRRVCRNCGYSFYTHETVEDAEDEPGDQPLQPPDDPDSPPNPYI